MDSSFSRSWGDRPFMGKRVVHEPAGCLWDSAPSRNVFWFLRLFFRGGNMLTMIGGAPGIPGVARLVGQLTKI
jgi:hypothetical protein